MNESSLPRQLKILTLTRKNKNKYDLINKNFNNKIKKGYMKIAKNNKRFTIIDASLQVNEIHNIIIKKIILKL